MRTVADIRLRVSEDEIRAFMNSFMWKDMKAEMAAWRKMFEKEPMSLVDKALSGEENSTSTLMHLGDIHGRVAAIDYILEMPNVFLSIKEYEKQEKELQRQQESEG